MGRIVCWLILLLEFYFTVKGIAHQRADHLSRLTHGEEPLRFDDDLPNAYLFNIEMVPTWSAEFIPLLTIGQWDIPRTLREKQDMIQRVVSFVMIAGQMYQKRADAVLRLCMSMRNSIFT